MAKSLAFFQGKIVPIEQAKVSVMTHALHYGTGVFEGIRGNWNAERETMYVFRLREHYERLLQGCRMLMMDIPYSVDDLCNITEDLIKASGVRQDVYIRPLAYKSEELVANLKLHEVESDFTLIIVPFGDYIDSDGAINCCTSSWRRMDDTIIPPRVKISGHYVNSILAKTEAVLAGFDEAIMLNQDGHVCEGTGENIFLVHGNTIATPTLESNVLPGVTRQTVLDLAHDHLGITIEERLVDRSELYTADEIFLTGTAAHIQGVGSVDHRPVGGRGIGPLTRKLQELYFPIVRGQDPKYVHQCTPATPRVATS